jgi:predicted ATPase
MIDKLYFKNYKSFKDKQEIVFKPITVVIGKNSSGKSAVVKLPTLLETSLLGKYDDPLLLNNNGVELGAEFRDLIYGREIGSLELSIKENNNLLDVEITSGVKDSDFPKIRKWQYNDILKLSYDDKKDEYFDEFTKQNYQIEFSGFKITNIKPEVKNTSLDISLNTNYVGPFREIPKRTYNISGSSKTLKVGNYGENAYQILINDYVKKGGKLLKQVSDWYENNFDGWGIQINDSSKPDYKIELVRNNPKFSINIKDVGEGMTQALPIVVSAFIEDKKEVLTILEQPELHLHPAAHGNLAELLALSSKTSNKRFLIETHSQNFILRLRRLVAEGIIDRNSLAIYFVDYDSKNNSSVLKQIEVNRDGSVSFWPKNIFSETLDETLAIRSAQLKMLENDN